MMKLTFYIIMVAFVLAPLTVWADATESDSASEPSMVQPSPATRFVQMWKEFNQTFPLSSVGLAYIQVTESWTGERMTRREIIRVGKTSLKRNSSSGIQTEHLFQILEALSESERFRDVKEDSKGIFSFILLRALSVTERNQTLTLDAQATCQMDEGLPSNEVKGRPVRFIFELNLPKGMTALKLQLVYTWDYRSFNESLYLVPSEILVEALVKRAGRKVVISQKWLLEKIIEVKNVEIDLIQEVEAKK